jgi:hypothetical protein
MPMTSQEAKFRLTQLRSHCHVSDIPLLSTPLVPAVYPGPDHVRCMDDLLKENPHDAGRPMH